MHSKHCRFGGVGGWYQAVPSSGAVVSPFFTIYQLDIFTTVAALRLWRSFGRLRIQHCVSCFYAL